MDLTEQLRRDEGLRLIAYDDATDKPIPPGTTIKGNATIGVGRNLIGRGITEDEAGYLLANDIAAVKLELGQALPWTSQLDEARLGVLLNMCFNMGIVKLQAFKRTLQLVQQGSYNAAATEMTCSAWAREEPERSTRLATQMATGVWQ